MSSTFPPASHSRASSATSLNSVPEESQSSTTNTLHAYIQTQRLNSPVYGNNLYTAQGALGLSQTVKSSSTRAAMTGVNNRTPTITLPRSKLRELKVVHGTGNNGGKTNSELAKVNGSGDGIVDVLQFLRRLDELCNRKSCGLPNLVSFDFWFNEAPRQNSRSLLLHGRFRSWLFSVDAFYNLNDVCADSFSFVVVSGLQTIVSRFCSEETSLYMRRLKLDAMRNSKVLGAKSGSLASQLLPTFFGLRGKLPAKLE